MTPARRAPAAPTVRRARDLATRDRLLRAATRQFAEHGFRHVTVRDICREAPANVAAVNYHFTGKLGLYREVVRAAIDAIREAGDLSMTASGDLSAADRLRHYVRTYLPRLVSRDSRVAWIHDLMQHEMSDPTPLAPWIAEQGIMPRIHYLSALVAELLGCKLGDRRVKWCVASIQAQCLFYAPHRFRAAAFRNWSVSPAELTAVVDHVAEFSLAGIERVGRGR
ncbi:MAG TPA: CerR family C-terminal domain-containing protein [Gemmatimonadaceae bacterium]